MLGAERVAVNSHALAQRQVHLRHLALRCWQGLRRDVPAEPLGEAPARHGQVGVDPRARQLQMLDQPHEGQDRGDPSGVEVGHEIASVVLSGDHHGPLEQADLRSGRKGVAGNDRHAALPMTCCFDRS